MCRQRSERVSSGVGSGNPEGQREVCKALLVVASREAQDILLEWVWEGR